MPQGSEQHAPRAGPEDWSLPPGLLEPEELLLPAPPAVVKKQSPVTADEPVSAQDQDEGSEAMRGPGGPEQATSARPASGQGLQVLTALSEVPVTQQPVTPQQAGGSLRADTIANLSGFVKDVSETGVGADRQLPTTPTTIGATASDAEPSSSGAEQQPAALELALEGEVPAGKAAGPPSPPALAAWPEPQEAAAAAAAAASNPLAPATAEGEPVAATPTAEAAEAPAEEAPAEEAPAEEAAAEEATVTTEAAVPEAEAGPGSSGGEPAPATAGSAAVAAGPSAAAAGPATAEPAPALELGFAAEEPTPLQPPRRVSLRMPGASPKSGPGDKRRPHSLPGEPRRKRLRRTWSRRHSQPGHGARAPGAGGASNEASGPLMRFNSDVETCSICCSEDVAPQGAVRLSCQHGWYCSSCMTKFAQARLELGAVHVPCPQCGETVAEHDLRRLLPKEVLDKLLDRSLEQAVSCQADLCACPTPSCPMRVALEDGETGRLKCPLCKKTSCVRCGAQPYHRGLSCEKHAERMRKRGGKEDEESLLRWMQETGTKQCPTCRMAVTKQNLEKQLTQRSECHKMMCRNCSTKFCFKCLAVLTAGFTCGCTIDAHGFVNPTTGRRVSHLGLRGRSRARSRARGKAKASGRRQVGRQ